ncbi:hypothetical protein, partial [Brucella cytisi]|uniref:hypothetical protein n=1 Tax=Brucella cytisi TaxID=407152 RepID=UPI0035BC75C2
SDAAEKKEGEVTKAFAESQLADKFLNNIKYSHPTTPELWIQTVCASLPVPLTGSVWNGQGAKASSISILQKIW